VVSKFWYVPAFASPISVPFSVSLGLSNKLENQRQSASIRYARKNNGNLHPGLVIGFGLCRQSGREAQFSPPSISIGIVGAAVILF
jgi:hypothetical protein